MGYYYFAGKQFKANEIGISQELFFQLCKGEGDIGGEAAMYPRGRGQGGWVIE